MTHEKLERYEKAVLQTHYGQNIFPPTKEIQALLDAKLLYYLKTEITIEELEKRATITQNKIKDILRKQGHKNVKDNIEIK